MTDRQMEGRTDRHRAMASTADAQHRAVTTVRYQGNALTDNFNTSRVQCLTLPVRTTVHVRAVNTKCVAFLHIRSSV